MKASVKKSSKLQLDAKKRDVFGKKLKKVRIAGMLPGNIFGPDFKSQSITVDVKEFRRIYNTAKETAVVYIKTDDKENLEIEFIQGKKLSESLDDLKDNLEICTTIGKQIALLHDNDIIHGDLTTSNMIYVPINKLNDKKDVNVKSSHQGSSANNNNNLKHPIPDLQDNNLSFKVYFIDFGLSYISKRAEDKAVDLHLIKQALEAKHFKHFESFFSHVLKGYEKTSKDSNPILERFKKVELRGRYKQQF